MTDLSKQADTLGYPAILPNHTGRRYLHNQRLGKVSIKPGAEVDERFLFYLLRTREYRNEVLASATGTTVKHTSPRRILAHKPKFPPLAEQKAIASVLGALDDKIELNRRMNATLEAMARALFQSWFVDFDPFRAKLDGGQPTGLDTATTDLFPNEFEDSELGPIPKGWEIGSILRQADLISGGTPKTDIAAYWSGDINWASAKDVSQCGEAFLIATEKKITRAGLENSATKIIPQFAVVIVARGATTGRLTMFGDAMAMNQTCYALRSKIAAPFALYCQAREFINSMVHAAHGSVFDTIITETFKATNVLIPPVNVLIEFNKRVAPLFDLVHSNLIEIRTLAAICDALLPKLLSGDLRVKDGL